MINWKYFIRVLVGVSFLALSVQAVYAEETDLIKEEDYELMLKEALDNSERMLAQKDDEETSLPVSIKTVETPESTQLSPPEYEKSPSSKSSSGPSAVIDILELTEADMKEALKVISQKSGLNIFAGEDITGKVSIYVDNIDAYDALRIIIETHDLAYHEEDGIIRILTKEEFERLFGYPFSQDIQTKIYPLGNDPGELLGELDQLKSASGKVIYSQRNSQLILIDEPQKLKSMEEVIKKHQVMVETRTFTLKEAQAREMALKIKDALEPQADVKIDSRLNAVIVTATAEQLARAEELVKQWDKKLGAIHLDAKVIQIMLNDEHLMGVDWEAIVSQFQSLDFRGLNAESRVKFGFPFFARLFGPAQAQQEENKLSLGTISDEDYVILLDALDTVGIMNTILEEQKETVDGTNAEVSVRSIDVAQVGIESQKPDTLHDDEQVRFVIVPNAVGALSKADAPDQDSYEIRIKPEALIFENNTWRKTHEETAEASIQVKNGSTIVIGGLFKEATVASMWKIPLLGDLPFVGFAFRNQGQQVRKTEIITFLTPKRITQEP